ncbi:MAG: precorrin-6Y C5,15-methyltransferase (decarboxylating) subunit CbiT, partial [Rikenellaceae bacterium]
VMGVLTDTKEHTPEKIAQRMLHYGYINYRLTVGEQLGNENSERVESYSVEQAAESCFSHPSNIIMERTSLRRRPFGIADNEFIPLNGRTAMITKMPIRMALLSLMELRESQTLWDVGFCTGSVSIEAKLQFPHLKVVSFEKREECREIIEGNITQFGALGIDYHIGDFMEQPLDGVPSPDVIFIGGHGGNLAAIVARCAKQLKEGGRLLFNSVSPESQALFIDSAKQCALSIEKMMDIQVDEFNRIRIIKTVK